MVLLKIFPFGFEIISYLSYKSSKRILIIFTQIHQLSTFYHTLVRTHSPFAMPAHARAHTHVIFLNNTNVIYQILLIYPNYFCVYFLVKRAFSYIIVAQLTK